MNTASLERKLVAALSDDIQSSVVAALLEEAKTGIAQATKQASEQAFDPLVTSDSSKARAMISDAEFHRERLCALLPRLEARYVRLQNDEEAAGWSADYEAMRIKRDEAAKRFERVQTLIAELIDLFDEAKAVDREVSVVNGSAPPGEFRRLHGVELTARNLPAFSREQPPLASSLRLPDYNRSDRLAFPPPTIPASVLIAAQPNYTHGTPTVSAPPAPAPALVHSHTGDWWRDNETLKREEQARVAKYYDDMARAREERETAEAKNRQRAV